MAVKVSAKPKESLCEKRVSVKKRMKKYWQIYLLMLAGIVFYILFKIRPVWGLGIAFVDYKPRLGLLGSPFVGFKYFKNFLTSPNFGTILRNTLVISLMNLFLAFPIPIILSLLFNEIRHPKYKKVIQSVVYMPHFMSWAVIAGITFFIFSSDIGVVNKLLRAFGHKPVPILTNAKYFWWVILFQNIWKEMGWGTIIYLSAISQVSMDMYEAAIVDGANRWQRMLNVTLPSIMSTIIVMFIMRIGRLMNLSFEQLWMMGNDQVRSVSETFDTYTFRVGVQQGNYSIGTAVGLFSSMVGLILVLASNKIIKATGNDGMF